MFEIITIPFDPSQKIFDARILNQFITNKNIINYRAEFFSNNEDAYWTVFIEVETVSKKPQRGAEIETLDKSQMVLYNLLGAWRKNRADQDGIAAFIIASNKNLVELVKAAPKTIEAMETIKGFGESKIEKYGKEFIEIITEFYKKDE